jgi:hypothetical protein
LKINLSSTYISVKLNIFAESKEVVVHGKFQEFGVKVTIRNSAVLRLPYPFVIPELFTLRPVKGNGCANETAGAAKELIDFISEQLAGSC